MDADEIAGWIYFLTPPDKRPVSIEKRIEHAQAVFDVHKQFVRAAKNAKRGKS